MGVVDVFETPCGDGSVGAVVFATAPDSPATRAILEAESDDASGDAWLAQAAKWLPRLVRAKADWTCE